MYVFVEGTREIVKRLVHSLPAWIAAGIEHGLQQNIDLAHKLFFALGYGSGDAAETMLLRMVENWQDAAGRIGFQRALEGAIDLTQQQYEALHDGLSGPCPRYEPHEEFIIDSIGQAQEPDFQDIGIEYYKYIP